MKSFDRLIALAAVLIAAMFVLVNVLYAGSEDSSARLAVVEIERVMRRIEDTGSIPDISGFDTITGVREYTSGGDFFTAPGTCAYREADGRLYRIDYTEEHDDPRILYVNLALSAFSVFVLGLLIYLRQAVIKPFDEIRELPIELSKGNLVMPLKQRSSRYFSRFLWGLDMLRENMAHTKEAELELQREKKTMLMSLSHDIKTPLSAIKLSSQALARGLYTDPERQRETAENISANAAEIERLTDEIMHANSEELMRFEINEREFYLSEVIGSVRSYYCDRLTGTEFTVETFPDCIMLGDPDKLTEVLRNIIENAVKYGDGRYIRISFSEEEDCRLVTVANSGCTLPENELTHVFESFWRGSNTGSQPGSGLGLYICRTLMRAMGGDIFAETSGGEMRVTAVCRKR